MKPVLTIYEDGQHEESDKQARLAYAKDAAIVKYPNGDLYLFCGRVSQDVQPETD